MNVALQFMRFSSGFRAKVQLSSLAVLSVLLELLGPVGVGAFVLVGAGVGAAVARLEEDAADLLVVVGVVARGPVVDAHPLPLVVGLPEGPVEVPDCLVHLKGVKLCKANLK